MKIGRTILTAALITLAAAAPARAYGRYEAGEYIICEINTQDDAIEIQDAPPINAVSEDLEEADEARPVYADVTITEAEGDLLERILWAEANNQDFVGQCAVIEVIFNRLRSPEWPDTIEGVLSQKGQFATWKARNKVTPTHVQSDVISEVLRETETVLPDTSYVFFDRRGVNGRDHVRIQDHVFGR